ncbi:MAG: two-component system sensor histidine kinase NtrB [Moorellaceae bacterium]
MGDSFEWDERTHIREKLAMVGELAAGMAHEIRNPLTSIRGFLQLLQRKFDGEGPEHEYFQIMLEELDRINLIIKEFLSLAKPSQPQLKITDINVLISEALLLAEQEALMNEVVLEFIPGENIPLVFLDPAQIKQVVLNLVSNAIQATGPKGRVEVSSLYDPEEQMVIIGVKDNGPGIPPDKLHRIFEPFFTTKENGTGLGLTLSLRIVESHKGRIRVSSKVGEGSYFQVYLPLA